MQSPGKWKVNRLHSSPQAALSLLVAGVSLALSIPLDMEGNRIPAHPVVVNTRNYLNCLHPEEHRTGYEDVRDCPLMMFDGLVCTPVSSYVFACRISM